MSDAEGDSLELTQQYPQDVYGVVVPCTSLEALNNRINVEMAPYINLNAQDPRVHSALPLRDLLGGMLLTRPISRTGVVLHMRNMQLGWTMLHTVPILLHPKPEQLTELECQTAVVPAGPGPDWPDSVSPAVRECVALRSVTRGGLSYSVRLRYDMPAGTEFALCEVCHNTIAPRLVEPHCCTAMATCVHRTAGETWVDAEEGAYVEALLKLFCMQDVTTSFAGTQGAKSQDVLHIVAPNEDTKGAKRKALVDKVCTNYVQQGAPDLLNMSRLAMLDGKHIILGAQHRVAGANINIAVEGPTTALHSDSPFKVLGIEPDCPWSILMAYLKFVNLSSTLCVCHD